MIPTLEQLRKSLVPDLAPQQPAEVESEHSAEVTAAREHSAPPPPPSDEFLVSRKLFPKVSSRARIVCRMCRARLESSIVLRPRRVRRTSDISRSSLEGWLKHDLVFFGESYLCEECARSRGFI